MVGRGQPSCCYHTEKTLLAVRVWLGRAGEPCPGVAQGKLLQVISAGDSFGWTMGAFPQGSWGCGGAETRLGQTGEGWEARIHRGGARVYHACLMEG